MAAKDRPSVTVVVPTRNHAHFLRYSIASVVGQTHAAWELVVIDDDSEDDTKQVIEQFQDSRIRLVPSRKPRNIAASRNLGVELSEAPYVAFLDSDDLWLPEKLSRCLQALDTGVDLICHGETFVWDDGRRKRMTYGPLGRATYRSLLYDKNCLSTSAVVIRKEVLSAVGGFSEEEGMVTAEDYDLWLRLAQTGCRFCFIPDILGEYRLHAGNSTKAVRRHRDATIAVLSKNFRGSGLPVTVSDRLRANRRIAIEYYVAARAFFQNGEWAAAAEQIIRSLPIFPCCRAV